MVFGKLKYHILDYFLLDSPEQKMVEASTISPEQFADFLKQVERMPGKRSPIDGKTARLSFEFMEDTGCRVNETIHVRKKDIDFSTRILTVTMPKTEIRCKCSKWVYADKYHSRRILEYADPSCSKCEGKGRYKRPQYTTITPRIIGELAIYCNQLNDNDLLFPISRTSLYKWAKAAGKLANINIFQKKQEKLIKGVFLHLFRELCSKRMIKDAKFDDYKDQLVACKLRHSFEQVTDRYTKIDINYLLAWETKTYLL